MADAEVLLGMGVHAVALALVEGLLDMVGVDEGLQIDRDLVRHRQGLHLVGHRVDEGLSLIGIDGRPGDLQAPSAFSRSATQTEGRPETRLSR